MVGGVTSGYSLIGSWVTAINPPASMTSDSTTAKIGRSMKKREKRTGAYSGKVALPRRRRRRGALGNHGSVCSGDLHPWANPHQAVDDDTFSGLEPGYHCAESVDDATRHDWAVLDAFVLLQHEHELPILISTDRLVLNQSRGVGLIAEESH